MKLSILSYVYESFRYPLLWKCLFEAVFCIVCLLKYWLIWVIYIFWLWSLCGFYELWMFSPILWFVFSPLLWDLLQREILNFNAVKLLSFYFMVYVFGLIYKLLFCPCAIKWFFYIFIQKFYILPFDFGILILELILVVGVQFYIFRVDGCLATFTEKSIFFFLTDLQGQLCQTSNIYMCMGPSLEASFSSINLFVYSCTNTALYQCL